MLTFRRSSTSKRGSAAHSSYDLSAFERRCRSAHGEELEQPADPHVAAAEHQIEARMRRLRFQARIGAAALLIGLGLALTSRWTLMDKLPFVLFFAGLTSLVQAAVEQWKRGDVRAAVIERFAADNGFDFTRLKNSAGHPGMLFTVGGGHHRWLTVFGRIGGRPVEFGNLAYFDEHKGTQQHMRGYIALRLPGRLPTTLITRRTNPYFAPSTPRYPHRENRIDIGQGRRVRIFTPSQAHGIVQTLLTPDVVPLLRRLTRRYTLEIEGDVLHLYRFQNASTGSARRWESQLKDVEELAELVSRRRVWDLIERYPRDFLRHIPAMRLNFHHRRPYLSALLVAAGILVFAVTVALAMTWDEVTLITWDELF